MASRSQAFEAIVREGFRLLESEMAYTQADMLRKMAVMGHKVSAPSFSNIITGKRAGKVALRKAGEAMLELVRSEIGYRFDEERLLFDITSRPDGWQPNIIPLEEEKKSGASYIFYPEGRLPIQQKVDFLKSARQEVIEFGVRLRTFADYFLSRSEQKFRIHIEELLGKGVNLKLYLLDPDCNEARLYFEDRGRIQEAEQQSVVEIRRVIGRLRQINSDFANAGFSGKFEVFSYKHIPYSHFLIVDGESRHGKLMASPYHYGVRRADCPVVEVSRLSDPRLYGKYWRSFQYLAHNARPISLSSD